MNNIITISSGIPVEARALAQKAKANNAKNSVNEVGGRMAALDNIDGVDLVGAKGSVEVNDAKLPAQSLTGSILGAVVPEKVTGFAEYAENGQMNSLYTSSKDITGTKDLQFQRNQDGSQVYAVSTPTGQTTVRENFDGTLFMMESDKPSSQDWAAMNSPSFTPPVLNPEDIARTTDDAKRDYKTGFDHRKDLLGGLLSDDTRGKALDGLKEELFSWNPFKKRS